MSITIKWKLLWETEPIVFIEITEDMLPWEENTLYISNLMS